MTTEETAVLMIKLKEAFKRLVAYQRLENDKPINKLKIIEKQLTVLLKILISWQSYTDFLYKTDEDILKVLDYGEGKKFFGFDLEDPNEELIPKDKKKRMVDDFGEEILDIIEEQKPKNMTEKQEQKLNEQVKKLMKEESDEPKMFKNSKISLNSA